MPAAQLSLFHSCPRLFEDCDESVLHQMGSCPCTKYSMVCKPTSPSDALLGPFLPIREELERGHERTPPAHSQVLRSSIHLTKVESVGAGLLSWIAGVVSSGARSLGCGRDDRCSTNSFGGKTMSKFIFRVTLLCTLVAASQAQAPPTQTCASTAAPPSRYQHIVVFSFENRTWSGVGGVGFGAMPYLHSLATSCSYFSDWTETNTSQNSLTQYIGETSGVNNPATVNDCNPSATCRSTDNNIFRQVRLAGGTARNYVEGATTGCSASGNGADHIPDLYYYGTYTDNSGVTHNDHDFCSTEVRPYTEFDVNNLPTYAFITPTLCNDGDDCNNSTVNAWASTNVQKVLNSASYLAGNTAVFVWYDEDHPTPNIQIAPTANVGDITTTGIGTHAALLKTIELLLGLPVMQQGQLTTAADLRAITGLASTGGSTVSVSISPTSATVPSGGTQQFTATVTGTSNAGVTWTATKGTVTSSGLYTAPTVTSNTTAAVTATSVADPTKSASATAT